jgi:hypothetical protein
VERVEMERTYTYKNAIIHIFVPDRTSSHFKKATETFMKKVIKEKEQNK